MKEGGGVAMAERKADAEEGQHVHISREHSGKQPGSGSGGGKGAGSGDEGMYCDRCQGISIFTKELKEMGKKATCHGIRAQLPLWKTEGESQERVHEDTSMMGEEESGELAFDCCIGTSYHTDKMKKAGLAPICAAGLHIARYKWPTKESASVVTGSDGTAVANQGSGRGALPPPPPPGNRAFGESKGGEKAPPKANTWSDSAQKAFGTCNIVIQKTAERMGEVDRARTLGRSLYRAHLKFTKQAALNMARALKMAENIMAGKGMGKGP